MSVAHPSPESSPRPSKAGTLRLCDIPLGQPVEIVDVELPPSEAETLFERGVLPGSVVRTVRRSPFGDPIVRVYGTILALRRETAAGLRVKPVATAG